jgi:Na+/proline symporter
MAALSGALLLDSLWHGVTRAGAIAGFWADAITFVLIHAEIISGLWLIGTPLEDVGRWFAFYAKSPYSAATFGGIVSVLVTVLVSRCSTPLDTEHLRRIQTSSVET